MMANLKVKAKKIIRELPYSVGRFIPLIPTNFIFGKAYNRFKNKLHTFSSYSDEQKKAYFFKNITKIVRYSYHEIPFYKDHYDRRNFHPDDLKSFDDIPRIPIVTKSDLVGYAIEERSNEKKASERINTGGTTGEPLEFYIEHNAMAREWAHMLHIWSQVGYKRTNLKLNFRGRNIGQQACKYNAVGHEYIINSYADLEQVSQTLHVLLQDKTVRYLHGYPSAIYEFAAYIKEHDLDLLQQLNKSVKGILLGSEYPAPIYRDLIEHVFDCPNISWYGHSEMCILAYEKNEKYQYEPMGSYGYCEAVPTADGNFRLIGTSFFNRASPFIRYDTGDLVKPLDQHGRLLKSFRIEKGRIGEFIIDKKGHRVSLTSLIFGRHHPAFGKAKFIQVHQDKKGEATILLTRTTTGQLSNREAETNFDTSNVDLDFTFQIIDEPYRTQSGKVPLLVQEIKKKI